MRDIYRTYTHTDIKCTIADLQTGRLKDIEYTLKSSYNNYSTLETKLANALEAENKRLIKIKSLQEYKITYYQKQETFIANADYFTVDKEAVNNKETKNKTEKKKGNKDNE